MRLHRDGPAVALVLALVFAGCSRGDSPTVDTGDGTTTTSSASTTLPATTTPSTAPIGLATPPVSASPASERTYLTGVRASATAGAAGASRVVFEFDPGVPGYVIEYISRPVTEDGSGNELAVEGAAVLQVRMVNAAGARFEGEKVVPTYTGPKRVPATGAGVVTEVVDTGDFEGQVTWVIGLRQKAPAITVTTLTGPSRLVIDVPAAAT